MSEGLRLTANENSIKTPQRPLRIGREGKYYEVFYVAGVAQERRLPTGESLANSTAMSEQPNSPNGSGKQQVLELQSPSQAPIAVRRRSQNSLPMPTPPVRRLRPNSTRSKESTPSIDSADVSEESFRPAQLSMVPEQNVYTFYNKVPAPRPVRQVDDNYREEIRNQEPLRTDEDFRTDRKLNRGFSEKKKDASVARKAFGEAKAGTLPNQFSEESFVNENLCSHRETEEGLYAPSMNLTGFTEDYEEREMPARFVAGNRHVPESQMDPKRSESVEREQFLRNQYGERWYDNPDFDDMADQRRTNTSWNRYEEDPQPSRGLYKNPEFYVRNKDGSEVPEDEYWMEEDEEIYEAPYKESSSGSVRRKSSKLMRKITGLFDRKKNEDSAEAETKSERSDNRERSESSKDSMTPSRKSKLGQFFSFNRKGDKKKNEKEFLRNSELSEDRLQNFVNIPEGMLRDVFIEELQTDRKVRRGTSSPVVKRPPTDFREWTPSMEDLRGRTQKAEIPETSEFYVPKIPPFQSSQNEPSTSKKTEIPVEYSEKTLASGYSDYPTTKPSKGSRRSSLAREDVNLMYEEFLSGNFVPESFPQNDVDEDDEDFNPNFARKLSRKASAIPAELRAPIYKPTVEEPIRGNNSESKSTAEVAVSPVESLPEEVEETFEEIRLDEEYELRDRRQTVHELRSFTGHAWMIVKMMIQDLIYGVPEEVWSDLHILWLIFLAMLIMLYFRGFFHYDPESLVQVFRSGFQHVHSIISTLTDLCVHSYATMDDWMNDASSNLVADTLNEI